MALVDTIPAFPIDPFSSPEFIHIGKSSTGKPKSWNLRKASSSSVENLWIGFRYQFVSLKILPYLRVLSCSFSFPTENISARFIFHLFALVGISFPSTFAHFLCASHRRRRWRRRGNIMRSLFLHSFDISSDVVDNWKQQYYRTVLWLKIKPQGGKLEEREENVHRSKVNVSTVAHEFSFFK